MFRRRNRRASRAGAQGRSGAGARGVAGRCRFLTPHEFTGRQAAHPPLRSGAPSPLRPFCLLFLLPLLCAPARADDVASYLQRHGLRRLLAVHLEQQLGQQSGAERQETVLRLADLYTRLLEATDEPEARARLEERSRRLLASASESAGDELRLELLRGQYRVAEKIAEQHRLRQSSPEDLDRAREVLSQIMPELAQLRGRMRDRLRAIEKRLMRSSGGDAVERAEQAERSQRLLAQCTFVNAWALYYQSWLNDRPDNARVAATLFAELLAVDPARPEPDDVSVDLRSTEAIARSILGMALCKSMTASSSSALRWLDLLNHPQAYPGIRNHVPAWTMDVLLQHEEFQQAQDVLEAAGKGDEPPPLAWIRLAAVAALEAQDRSRTAADLASVAVAMLAARGELETVLDLAERYGAGALGDSGFASSYVRGVEHYQRARREHGDDRPTFDTRLAREYDLAAEQFAAAIDQPDAGRFPEAAANCRWLVGWCRYFEGRYLAARESFELAAEQLGPDKAPEALWMAVVSLDTVAGRRPELAVELNDLIDKALSLYPDGEHAATLKLKRALGAEPSPEVVGELLAIKPDSEVYPVAQRRAVQILYQLYRESEGQQQLVYGNEYLEAAIPLLDEAEIIEHEIDTARRVLDVALADGIGRRAAAESVLERLDRIETAGTADLSPYADELDFRRIQVRLADADADAAGVIADGLWQRDPASVWSRLAEGRLFRYGLRHWKSGEDGAPIDPAYLDLVVTHGRRVVAEFADDPEALSRPRVLSYHAAVAEALMTAGELGDAARTSEALDLYETLLAARPRDAGFLRAVALLSERLDRVDRAIDCWRTLVAAGSGDPAWFEAKFHLISLLARSDPARARAVMDQHKQLNPDYGPEPWSGRLRELDGRLPQTP